MAAGYDPYHNDNVEFLMGRDLSFLFPEMVLAVTMALMLVAEMVRFPRISLTVGLAGLALSTALTWPLLGLDIAVFGGTYRIDLLSTWAKLILLPGTALSLLLARAELAGTDREGSVYSLICLVTLGALMLTGTGDMMLLVLGVVLTGLGSFALVAYPRDDAATEAAMKYLVFGAVTGAVMIYGLTFWFGGAGSTLFSELGGMAGGSPVMVAGLLAVIIGLGYKAALVPFHFWAPDAYDGAPVAVAAFLSVITKIAAIFAFAQVVRDLPTSTGWPLILALIAAVTMTYGYLTALVQSNVVRLLAYSSIAQSGYFLLGIVAVGTNALALQSVIVFGAAYVVMNIGAFAMVLVAGRHLDDFRGFGRSSPVAGLAMVVLLLSLTGIPPLFGFAGKFLLFGAAIQAGFTWLVVIAIVNSVLALAVYLRIIVPMYQQREKDADLPMSGVALTFTWGFATFVTLVGGLAAQALLGRMW
jgi:NADH-quinone oxidoreductase subunit N